MKDASARLSLISMLIVALLMVFELRKTTDNPTMAQLRQDLNSAKALTQKLKTAKAITDIQNQTRIELIGSLNDSKQDLLELLTEVRYQRKEDVRTLEKETVRRKLENAKVQSDASFKADELRSTTLETSIANADKRIRDFELRLKEIDRKIAELEHVPVFAFNKNQIINQLNSVPNGLRFVPDPAFNNDSNDRDQYFTAVNFPASLNIHLSRVGEVRDISVVIDLDKFVESSKKNQQADPNLLSNQALLMKSVHSLADLLDTSLQQFRADSDKAIDRCLWQDGKVEIYDGDATVLGVSRTENEGKMNVHITFRCQSPKNKDDSD